MSVLRSLASPAPPCSHPAAALLAVQSILGPLLQALERLERIRQQVDMNSNTGSVSIWLQESGLVEDQDRAGWRSREFERIRRSGGHLARITPDMSGQGKVYLSRLG
jgi:hypothetical protein